MRSTMKFSLLLLVVPLLAQQPKAKPKPKPAPIKWSVCVEPIAAYGEHVRFMPEEHVQVLLYERKGTRSYEEWRRTADYKLPLDKLIDAKTAYDKITSEGQGYMRALLDKYKIGPGATFDDDMGGATPMGGCGKYEEKETPF